MLPPPPIQWLGDSTELRKARVLFCRREAIMPAYCLRVKGHQTLSGFQSQLRGSEPMRLLLLILGSQGPALWNWYVGHH